MQQILLVEKNLTHEINSLLEQGWRVVSVTPAVKHTGKYDTSFYGVYVVIEKDGDEKNA